MIIPTACMCTPNRLGSQQQSAGAVVDKRLLTVQQQQQQYLGAAAEGSRDLLLQHSGWTSFNSDVSNLTSGSAASASSVDLLLQSRQVNSEQVLINLGFGGSLSSSSTAHMYSRVPQRFLVTQQSGDSQDDDGIPENPSGEDTPNRSPLRGQCQAEDEGCLDSEYYTYVLNRVPSYFFKEKAPSEHSSSSCASSDFEDLSPLDKLAASSFPPGNDLGEVLSFREDPTKDVHIPTGNLTHNTHHMFKNTNIIMQGFMGRLIHIHKHNLIRIHKYNLIHIHKYNLIHTHKYNLIRTHKYKLITHIQPLKGVCLSQATQDRHLTSIHHSRLVKAGK
ncbi:hypothetical protein ACOMHN_007146 [Nucella lapillus]